MAGREIDDAAKSALFGGHRDIVESLHLFKSIQYSQLFELPSGALIDTPFLNHLPLLLLSSTIATLFHNRYFPRQGTKIPIESRITYVKWQCLMGVVYAALAKSHTGAPGASHTKQLLAPKKIKFGIVCHI